MKLRNIVRVAATTLLAGALLVPSGASAPAVVPTAYPPHVSVLYASPFIGGGYTTVAVSGEHLSPGMTIRATRSSRSTTAKVSLNAAGSTGVALVKVSSLLPKTAGRYSVGFTLVGSQITPAPTTQQTYTIGRQIQIKSFSVKGRSYGLLIHGKAASKTPVKITVKFGSKVYSKTVTSSKKGYFDYKFTKKKSKGTYTVTAKVSANTKYFSSSTSKTYVRR